MTFSRIFQSLFALLTISVPATNAQQTFFDAIGGRTVRASGSNLVGYGNINNNNYDSQRNLTTRLQLENWNQGDDLVLHGLDIWQSDESPNEVRRTHCFETHGSSSRRFGYSQ
ncbi:unnamed protein product [Alternaria alternata]